jgi:hypothetical protein
MAEREFGVGEEKAKTDTNGRYVEMVVPSFAFRARHAVPLLMITAQGSFNWNGTALL